MIWFQSPNVEVETFVYVSIHLLEELITTERLQYMYSIQYYSFTVYLEYRKLRKFFLIRIKSARSFWDSVKLIARKM